MMGGLHPNLYAWRRTPRGSHLSAEQQARVDTDNRACAFVLDEIQQLANEGERLSGRTQLGALTGSSQPS